MNTVKKYATFEEMKSSEVRTTDLATSLKKHQEFEMVMRSLRAAKELTERGNNLSA